jgi:chitodextrinase
MANKSLAAVTCAIAAFVLGSVVGLAPAAAAPRDTPPTAPTNLRATAVTQTTVTLAWSPSTDDVGVREYAAWAPATPGVSAVTPVRVPASQTTATLTSLRPNSTYNFQVQAWDGRNWSWQAVLTLTTPRELVAPSAPSGLSVSGVTASTAMLSWGSSTDNFGPITYEVLVNGVPTPNAWSTRPAGTPPGAVDGAQVRQLRPDTTYQLAVRARDGSGNLSAASNTVTVTTVPNPDVTAPTTPTLLSANIGAAGYCPDEIWLTWSASTDGAQPASAIEYEVRVNGTIIEVITGGTRTVSYTEVHGAITVTVVAVDRAGNASGPSNSMSGRTNWGQECFS